MQGIEMLILAMVVSGSIGYALGRITNPLGRFRLAHNKRRKMNANEQHWVGTIRTGYSTNRVIITPSELVGITNRAEKNPEDFA